MYTLVELWEIYAREHLARATLSPHLRGRKWEWLDYYQGPMPGSLSSPMGVEPYVQRRRSDGVRDSTINLELNYLRACLHYAFEHKLISERLSIAGVRLPKTQVAAITWEQAKWLISVADQRGRWREQAFVRIALGTGARCGAICGLRWDQVSMSNRYIDFGTTSPLTARMKRRAVVPINALTKRGLSICQANRDGSDYVIHRAGVPIGYPRKLFKGLAKAAGMPDLHPHVLRHTVASHLLEQGVDTIKVSRLLGHANTHVTETIYFQHQPKWLIDTVNLLK